MKDFLKIWRNFWNNPVDIRGYCLCRMLTGLLFLYSLSIYFVHFEEWILNSPQINSGILDINYLNRVSWTLFNFLKEPWSFYLIFVLLTFAVILFTLGIGERITSLLSYLFFLSLANQNPGILFGFDEYLGGYLFIFVLYPGMEFFSVKKLFSKHQSSGAFQEGIATVAIRIFQVVFCLRYLSAGLYKPSVPWSNGSIIWQLLNNQELQKIDISFMHDYWQVLGWISLSVKIFEILFIPLIIWPPSRIYTIMFGLGMHLSIGLFTPLMVFSLLLMAGYATLIPTNCYDSIQTFFRKGNFTPSKR